jgi:hypothetical protein
MARNIEIKARVSDLAAFRAKAAPLASGPKQILARLGPRRKYWPTSGSLTCEDAP